MGMERNSDIVTMASYAPLFCEPAWKAWNPNAINFDGGRVYGIPSYHLQVLFANNRADTIVPVTVDSSELPAPDPDRGRIALGSWDTQADFKDIKVSDPDGKTLWEFDPAKGLEQFEIFGRNTPRWKVEDGMLRQIATGGGGNFRRPQLALAGDREWGDYTMTLKARKVSGAEGFIVAFHLSEPGERTWWNVGGWGNKRHGLEGEDLPQSFVDGSIETNRWYDLKIDLRGPTVTCYLDGKKIHEATATNPNRLFAIAGTDRAKGEVILKVVNPAKGAVKADIDINGAPGVSSAGRAIVLGGENLSDENSFDQPQKVAPREQTIDAGKTFSYSFPGFSVTVLRVKTSN